MIISKNNLFIIQRYKIYLIYDFKKLKTIPDYENLGFTLKSLCKITQTALLAELSFPNYTEHDKWDVYNILQLLRSLIPEDELELLDKLNS
ncbi:hypothetical protein O2K51_00745 [Apibacter raozihei]|uniref:hypothetical protein n=1 Tax=Apibacter raozihei TaxID=2500547 RepID=UPI000FE3AE2B|nr:hypothetical protein [Apibacter raozihei]